jgi:cell division protease FtsH
VRRLNQHRVFPMSINKPDPHERTGMNANFRNFALWVIIGLLLIALFNLFQNPGRQTNGLEIPYSQFLADIDQGDVRTVMIAGNEIVGTYTDNRPFQTYAPDDPNLVARLDAANVIVNAQPATEGGTSIWGVLLTWLPMILIIAVWIFFMRQMQGSGRAGSRSKTSPASTRPSRISRRSWSSSATRRSSSASAAAFRAACSWSVLPEPARR